MNTTERPTRRGFVGWLSAGLAAVPGLGMLAVALRSGAMPEKVERPARMPLCRKSDVPATGVLAQPVTYEMRRGARVDFVATTVFLTREGGPDGPILALSSRCTHLGCPVIHEPGDADAPFVCPCHDAKFAADGTVLDGPPPRPLDRLPIDVPGDDDGTIHLLLENGGRA